MDNVTHTLAGLVLAEAAVQLRRARARRGPGRGGAGAPSPGFRLAAAVAGAVAANLPDGDLLYTSFAGDRLAYLLHHRGHTHTLPAAALGALLTWAAAVAVWRARAGRAGAGPAPDTADRRWLFGVVLAGVLSHLALDWTNNYGVHPFWPVDNRWRYGDAVFIVEPWLWAASVPALVAAARRPAARVALALVLAAGLALAWVLPAMVPRGAALALTLGAAAALVAVGRLGPGRRAAFAVGAWMAVELAFAAGTRAARARVAAAARASDPGARLADVVVTPGPTNPLCATAIVVEAAGPGGADYRVTTAWASAAPALLPVARCAAGGRARAAGTLVMAPSPRPATAAVRWDRTWQAPRAELAALYRGNCEAAAMLRFVRVPFWFRAGPGTVHLGDVRYDGEPGLGFAELLVPERPAVCPARVPPWRPPRADLLGG